MSTRQEDAIDGDAPGTPSAPRRVVPWAAVVAWAGALTAIMLWPLTRGGYLLAHDMVFTPRQPLDLASIGLSSAAPRAVPLDALVALAEKVLDGAVVGRLALVLPLVAAGLGAATLLSSRSSAARLAACGTAVWTPFVVERLAIGQWALLWAYAALPWLIVAIRDGRGWSGWAARALALATASITPTGALIAATSAVVASATLRQPRRTILATTALAIIVQLPWLLPALLSRASGESDPAAVAAFAARAEHPGGALLSLLGGGGIWDADVVPASRSGGLAWVYLALVVLAGLFGGRHLARLIGTRLVVVLGGLAVAGLALATLPTLPGGDSLMRAAVTHLPGAGLLRDSQKWIMPLVLFEALLAGAATDRVASRLKTMERQWRTLAVVCALVGPLIVFPDAAATVRPTVEPVHYPHDWAVLSQRVHDGEVTVLPFASYRRFAWTHVASVLDPAPRLLPVPTVVDDRLAVSGRLLVGEDPRARAVGRALTARTALAARLGALGITWVVVELGTPGALPDLSDLPSAYRGRDVLLYRVPGVIMQYHFGEAKNAVVLVGDILVVIVLVGLGWAWPVSTLVRRHRRRMAFPQSGPLI